MCWREHDRNISLTALAAFINAVAEEIQGDIAGWLLRALQRDTGRCFYEALIMLSR